MKTKLKNLTIEWKHLDRGGRTCDRCSDTGYAVRQALKQVKERCRPSGVSLKFLETKLPPSRLKESNAILFNGVPLEKVLTDAQAAESRCSSCSDLLATETQCRTVAHGGKTHEAIPSDLIFQAACHFLGCDCGAG